MLARTGSPGFSPALRRGLATTDDAGADAASARGAISTMTDAASARGHLDDDLRLLRSDLARPGPRLELLRSDA